ncbi:hypothetical protein CAEBREN_10684 [Caenorhabditis brenneri]|uniref:Uncharacterized protein n=1 Tax=Caenorhabditis brenneri TaxID=135651 RepID=G0NLA7_CAEBE|nr:hypothetical protein CAEBREN_10684 [Caenorhabditis brenneri]
MEENKMEVTTTPPVEPEDTENVLSPLLEHLNQIWKMDEEKETIEKLERELTETQEASVTPEVSIYQLLGQTKAFMESLFPLDDLKTEEIEKKIKELRNPKSRRTQWNPHTLHLIMSMMTWSVYVSAENSTTTCESNGHPKSSVEVLILHFRRFVEDLGFSLDDKRFSSVKNRDNSFDSKLEYDVEPLLFAIDQIIQLACIEMKM